jgi:hypothetical protein
LFLKAEEAGLQTIDATEVEKEEPNIMNTPGHRWLLFAACALSLAGVMQIVGAVWAFIYHRALPAGVHEAVIGHGLNTFGWIYTLGAAVFVTYGGEPAPHERTVHV